MSHPRKTQLNVSTAAQQLHRLGKNLNGYFGETIDIDTVLADCTAAALGNGWSLEEIPTASKQSLLAFSRAARIITQDGTPNAQPAPNGTTGQRTTGPREHRRVYISTGIHGDEPAGPLAVRHLLQENRWPAEMDFWLLPCLNPAGFRLNRRENANGIDLNRQYLQPKAEEILAHIAWLEGQPNFDLCLCLHEDWESQGFYVYELNPDNRTSLAEVIIARVSQVCPIDRSDAIEGRPAREGIIRPSVDPRSRPEWPEAFYLLTHKTRLSYTLEAPSDFPLSGRVAALAAGVDAALQKSISSET